MTSLCCPSSFHLSPPCRKVLSLNSSRVFSLCKRLMTEDLLQDLVLYKKSHEKAVSTAARSLVTLFREICPSLLVKKDRGRPNDPKARPKAFGEVSVPSDVPDIELLQDDEDDDDDSQPCGSDGEVEAAFDTVEEHASVKDDEEEEDSYSKDDELDEDVDVSMDDDDTDILDNDDSGNDSYDNESHDEDINDGNHHEETSEKVSTCSESHNSEEEDNSSSQEDDSDNIAEEEIDRSKARKRKFVDYDEQLNAADTSLRALKRLAGAKMAQVLTEETDGFLSNEDFQRIKELKAKKEAKLALVRHGVLKKGSDSKATAFKVPSSEQLSIKRVDPAILEAAVHDEAQLTAEIVESVLSYILLVNIRRKLNKEERLAVIKAGREDRGKYMPRAAVKQKKTGGLSNRQKEHKKAMPLAAKRAKVARSRQAKKKAQKGAGKQFRGKKAWK